MTIITHDDGTGERVHLAYEGPYPWDDGARMKAIAGVDGWGILTGPRPTKDEDMLQGALVSDWDFSTGTFLGTRPKPPEPTTEERLSSEEQELLSYLASTDWYGIRLAETGEAPPVEVSNKRQEARNRISEIRIQLKSMEGADELEANVR